MRILLVLMLVFGGHLLPAQSLKDQLEEGDDFIRADYQNLYFRAADRSFVQQIFHLEKRQRTHRMTFADRDFRVLDGPYTEWYDNGQLWVEGFYQQGQRQGVWKYYSFDDKVVEYSGSYHADQREGAWHYFDTLGRVKTVQSYRNGKRDGEYKIFNTEDGSVKELRVYENDKLISRERFGEPADMVADTSIWSMPEVMPYMRECEMSDVALRRNCSDQLLLRSVNGVITYPRRLRNKGIQGKPMFRFVVEKDGSVSNLITLRGVSRDLEEECLRVIALLPAWHPGSQNGHPVRAYFILPFKFTLE